MALVHASHPLRHHRPSLPFDPCPPRVKRGDGERQRDNRRGDEKNTGKHRRDYRSIRKADRSKVFSCSQTPAVSPGSWPYLERTRIFSDRRANVRKTLFSPSSNSNAIFEKKILDGRENIYILRRVIFDRDRFENDLRRDGIYARRRNRPPNISK